MHSIQCIYAYLIHSWDCTGTTVETHLVGNKEVDSVQLLVVGKAQDGYGGVGTGSLHGDGIILYLDCGVGCTNLASDESKLIAHSEPMSTS